MKEYSMWRESVCRILLSQLLVMHESCIPPDMYYEYYVNGMTPAQAVKDDLGQDAIRFIFDQRLPEQEAGEDGEE